MSPRFPVSDDRVGDALDVLDAGNGAEPVLELAADLFVGVVDEEPCVDLHEAECDGLDGGLEDLDALGDDIRQLGDDSVEIDFCALGHEVVGCCDLSHRYTSRSDESAFLALVGDALVAALGAPSDLVLSALGALEEGVSAANQPLPAGRAYFVGCHAHAIRVIVFKRGLRPEGKTTHI